MVESGELYQDRNTMYHVVQVHFHWQTKERFVEFISMRSGFDYILEENKFLETRSKFDGGL